MFLLHIPVKNNSPEKNRWLLFLPAPPLRSASLARLGCFILPEWAWGEGINKGNLVPLISLGGLEPCEKVPSFLQLFFKKSWGMRLDFANALLRGGRAEGLHNRRFRPNGRNLMNLNCRELEFKTHLFILIINTFCPG